MNKKMNIHDRTVMLVVLALLSALCVVISMFMTIHTQGIKITLTFIPIAIAARLYGPIGGGVVAGLADIIEALISSVSAWIPPITVTNIVVGILFGILLNKRFKMVGVISAILISEFVFSLFVTTLWLNLFIFTGSGYGALVLMRLPQIGIMSGLKLVLIPALLKAMDRIMPQIMHPVSQKAKEKLP